MGLNFCVRSSPLRGRDRDRDKDRHRQAGRQTGRQAGRQRDRQKYTDRQTEIHRQTDRQTIQSFAHTINLKIVIGWEDLPTLTSPDIIPTG